MSPPWWAKIAAKLVIGRLPIPYRLSAKLGVGRHGRMDQQDYARGVFDRHFSRTSFGNKHEGFTCLELGPGDSLYSALFAHVAGAARTYLVDAGNYANLNLESYKSVARSTVKDANTLSKLLACTTHNDINAVLGGEYLTEGLVSLETIPDQSVDFIWSHAVLEHVRIKEFAKTITECRRILKATGSCSHRIDLKDHLGGGLNNLRIGSSLWERDTFAESGFYTNRLRHSEITSICKQAGFDVEVLKLDSWDTPPLVREKMAAEFRQLSEEDLRISGMDIILTPR